MKINDALKEWGDYQGAEAEPADFDAFWDKAKAEVDSLGYDYELVPAEFSSTIAKCYDLSFTGVHHSKIYAQLLLPKKSNTKHPGVFQFHGYHSDVGDWSDKLSLVSEDSIAFSIGGDNYCYAGTDIIAAININMRRKKAKLVLWGCSIEPELLEKEKIDGDEFDRVFEE